MRNESIYQLPIILNIGYRQPRSAIDKEDAQEEITDLLSEHQETIANMIADLIDMPVEIDDIETAVFQGSRVMV